MQSARTYKNKQNAEMEEHIMICSFSFMFFSFNVFPFVFANKNAWAEGACDCEPFSISYFIPAVSQGYSGRPSVRKRPSPTKGLKSFLHESCPSLVASRLLKQSVLHYQFAIFGCIWACSAFANWCLMAKISRKAWWILRLVTVIFIKVITVIGHDSFFLKLLFGHNDH